MLDRRLKMRVLTSLVLGLTLGACAELPDPGDPVNVYFWGETWRGEGREDDRRRMTVLRPPDTPPAVTGGTMALTRAGRLAIAHPRQGGVFLVQPDGELWARAYVGRDRGEPGRMVADSNGRLHLLQRRLGRVRTFDDETLEELASRPICAGPRGIDYDPTTDELIVACAEGVLLTLPAGEGPPTRSVFVDTDLRDIIVDGDRIYVSRFHSAELLVLDREGQLLSRTRPAGTVRDVTLVGTPADPETAQSVEHDPGVAYRIALHPDGGVVMLHQQMRATAIPVGDTPLVEQVAALRATQQLVPPSGFYYAPPRPPPEAPGLGTPTESGACGEVVESALTRFDADGARVTTVTMASGMLHVDMAVSPRGQVALASAAGPTNPFRTASGSLVVDLSALDDGAHDGGCIGAQASAPAEMGSVVMLADGSFAFLDRDDHKLYFYGLGTDGLRGGVATFDADHDLPDERGYRQFHAVSRSGVACASCHPEGGEDGHTWLFDPTGPRRTQTLLLPSLESTGPFHWSGDAPDLETLIIGALAIRMGEPVFPATASEVTGWLRRQPVPPPASVDPSAADRGERLYVSRAGCSDCHGGRDLTSNETLDVGTGGAFQVPSLVGVGHRAPFFHDGCAPTLDAVVAGECSEPDAHGRTATLDADERDDLVAYLRTL